MSIKEMWNYLIFQTKGYRQLGAAIVAGAVCGAGISYINSILYARIIDTLLLEQYTTAVHYVWIMILAVLVVRLVYIMCNQIFEQYASPSRDETKRRTAEKTFSMEFEEIEKEENQIAFRRTRGGVNGAGDIEAQLDSIYKFFTECVKVLFALVFLLILIVQSAQGAHVAAWKIILMTALLAGMFAFSFWVNVRVSESIGKKQVELNHENERINFLYGYLFKIFTSETAAKDIRLYGMQDYLCGKNEEEYYMAVADSFMLSADNAHAVHPNYQDKTDPTNRPYINEGIVLKYNASQKYTTDANSAALVKYLCKKEKIKCQVFFNRSDMLGGSTLGNILTGQVSIKAADIGLPQLSMHSTYETAGCKDLDDMITLMESFYELGKEVQI